MKIIKRLIIAAASGVAASYIYKKGVDRTISKFYKNLSDINK